MDDYDPEREERASRKTDDRQWGPKEMILLAIALSILGIMGALGLCGLLWEGMAVISLGS